MPSATVTSKGQITLPVELRRRLKLKAGDKIDFFEFEDGRYGMQPKTGSITDLKGILQKLGCAPLGYAPTVEEMNEDIAGGVAESDKATLSTSEAQLENDHAA